MLAESASCALDFIKGSGKGLLGVFEDIVHEVLCGLAHFAALLLCLLCDFRSLVSALTNNFFFFYKGGCALFPGEDL